MAKREVNVRGIEWVVTEVVNNQSQAYVVCQEENEALVVMNMCVEFGLKVTMVRDSYGHPNGVLLVEQIPAEPVRP